MDVGVKVDLRVYPRCLLSKYSTNKVYKVLLKLVVIYVLVLTDMYGSLYTFATLLLRRDCIAKTW